MFLKNVLIFKCTINAVTIALAEFIGKHKIEFISLGESELSDVFLFLLTDRDTDLKKYV